MIKPRRRDHHRSGRLRRGVALVEFALMLPIYVLIVLGTIEACSMIFLKQSLEIAAYEGARTALVPTTTTANVNNTCQQVLTVRKVRGATVTISPANFSAVPYGSFINVTVSAPCNQNSVIPPWFYRNRRVIGDANVMQEKQ